MWTHVVARQHGGGTTLWDDANLIGRTEIGRATIQVLAMNDPAFRAVRIMLLHEDIDEWD